ncbi:MAG: DUF192 domain-containing protein [Bacteroidetes bacterium]|nr:DUF192 domain-containing protein [Bacteroidota bacterium]
MNRQNDRRSQGTSFLSGKTVVSILFILLLPLIASFSYSQSNAQQQPGGESTGQSGPKFKNEGQLVFLKHGTDQTITVINIEIADNDEERAQGLMWRTSMPEDDGMLFIFGKERTLTFWMKNTYIPLDMVFADKSGKIVTIYPNATPLSEASIVSDQPAKYVVEVNGGFCARYGIADGDIINFMR